MGSEGFKRKVKNAQLGHNLTVVMSSVKEAVAIVTEMSHSQSDPRISGQLEDG